MDSSEKTWRLCAILVVGFVAAVIYHSFLSFVLGVEYPGSTFLYNPEIRFSDFYWIFEPVQAGSPLSGQWSLYPPFAYLPLFPFTGLSWPVAYAIVAFTFLFTLVWFFWTRLDFLSGWRRLAASIIIPCLTTGVTSVLDRGNIDMIAFVFALAFFVLFARGRMLWSSLPLAAAIASKIFPGALGVLLLLRRQYLAASLTAALTIALTLGASALYPGGIAGTLDLMSQRADFMESFYVRNPAMHQGSLSYLSLIKIFCRVVGIDFVAHSDLILLVYNIFSGALFAAVVAYVLLREPTLWKQVYLLVFLMLVIPPISFDYKLIFLLLPTALFLIAPPDVRRNDLLYVSLIGLILIPKGYFPLDTETKVSGLINPPALTFIAAYIIWTGLRRSRAATDGNPPAEQAPAASLAR